MLVPFEDEEENEPLSSMDLVNCQDMTMRYSNIDHYFVALSNRSIGF